MSFAQIPKAKVPTPSTQPTDHAKMPAHTAGPSGLGALSASAGPVFRLSSPDIHQAAQDGIKTPASTLPFAAQIQQSFGHHPVSDIQGHVGPAAATSAAAMNASAYATGTHVVFGGTPDLHTAAHEAAHVLQQRSGIQLLGGIGQPGDAYEVHADSVADRVTQGDSAEDLLDEFAGGHATEPAIQRKVGFEFETEMPLRANGQTVIAKNERVYTSPSGDWHITPDASNVEFVTEPFQEEGSAPETARMEKAVQEMASFFESLSQAADMNALAEQVDTPLSSVVDGGTLKQFKGHDLYVPKDKGDIPLTAIPQVTGGVSMENIPALFAAAYSTELPLESGLPGETVMDDPIARTRSQKTPVGGSNFLKDAGILARSELLAAIYVSPLKHKNVEGWEKLQGLIALIYSYLLAGDRQATVTDQAKYLVPLMSRMSFSAMFSSLPRPAQAAFDPATILENARLAPDEPLYRKGYSDPGSGDKQVVPQKSFGELVRAKEQKPKKRDVTTKKTENYSEQSSVVTTIGQGPVRKVWLEGILLGRDFMSAEGGTSVTKGMAASSPAMGQYSHMDPDHQGAPDQLAQIELRRLPRNVQTDEWLVLAQSLFVMFQQVQSRKKT